MVSEDTGPHFFDELTAILERLRGPGGCPWDREQTMTDLRPYIVEEAYELTDAITRGDAAGVREESGDLLLQIVFLASIASASENEAERFGMRDVVRTICDKLIRRHPHVFGDTEVDGSAQVMRNWERIKEEERKNKKEPSSVLAGIPKGLPPLLKAHRIQGKAAHVGFDWPRGDPAPLFDKLYEEADELRQAAARGAAKTEAHVEEELGDLLFMTVNLARHLDVDPDAALSRACDKFSSRFRDVERSAAAAGRRLDSCTLSELNAFWENAKRREMPAASPAAP
ncbi:MAG: nucleoside triphosphate pyrophosphohydrolase [Synergistaceae bacterium]|jgi:MazG family protein|nr:nucleoside triphosphate pyrophosphohydrolase [Synergistaceae bacterium]